MFKFFTVVFLMYYLARAFKPKSVDAILKKAKEIIGESNDTEIVVERSGKEVSASISVSFELMVFLVAKATYLFYAIEYDICRVPTYLMLALVLMYPVYIMESRYKKESVFEHPEHKSRVAKTTAWTVINTIYFGCMLYVTYF